MTKDGLASAYNVSPLDGGFNQKLALIRSETSKIFTQTIVKVIAVNTDNTIDILPLSSQKDGYGNLKSQPVVHNAQVYQYQGNGCAVLIMPAVGDIGWCNFAHNDISNVVANKAEALPETRRRHSLSDAMYMGGLLFDPPATNITMTPGNITITSNIINANCTTFNINGTIQQTGGSITSNGVHIDSTHKHSGVQPGAGNTGIPI